MKSSLQCTFNVYLGVIQKVLLRISNILNKFKQIVKKYYKFEYCKIKILGAELKK